MVKIKCGIQTVVVEPQPWDSNLLGRQCGRVVDILGNSVNPDYRALPDGLRQAGMDYVILRRPQDRWAELHALEAAGFRILDGILTLHRDLKVTPAQSQKGIRLAGEADADGLGQMAARVFRYSRFHNDPLLSDEIAAKVHYEWTRNSCLGSAAKAVLVAEEDGKPAGFVTCKDLGGGSGQINLVSVDVGFQGKGWARKLSEHACAWFSENGFSQVEVQTQTSNFSAMRAYLGAGFAVEKSWFTLRWAP
ncbi:MAG: GNAT family N-acetyltransferase [Bdellovibrionales bacterium]